jgi:hypothetical protein
MGQPKGRLNSVFDITSRYGIGSARKNFELMEARKAFDQEQARHHEKLFKKLEGIRASCHANQEMNEVQLESLIQKEQNDFHEGCEARWHEFNRYLRDDFSSMFKEHQRMVLQALATCFPQVDIPPECDNFDWLSTNVFNPIGKFSFGKKLQVALKLAELDPEFGQILGVWHLRDGTAFAVDKIIFSRLVKRHHVGAADVMFHVQGPLRTAELTELKREQAELELPDTVGIWTGRVTFFEKEEAAEQARRKAEREELDDEDLDLVPFSALIDPTRAMIAIEMRAAAGKPRAQLALGVRLWATDRPRAQALIEAARDAGLREAIDLLANPFGDSPAEKHLAIVKVWLPEMLRPKLLAEGIGDGAGVRRFEAAAIGKTNTLVFVRATTGSLFGGFLACAWTADDWCKDRTNRSFIFTLENHLDVPPTKFDLVKPDETAFCSSHNFGFGGGYDFSVRCDGKSFSNFGDSYRDTTGRGRALFSGNDGRVNDGVGVECWELWQVE